MTLREEKEWKEREKERTEMKEERRGDLSKEEERKWSQICVNGRKGRYRETRDNGGKNG